LLRAGTESLVVGKKQEDQKRSIARWKETSSSFKDGENEGGLSGNLRRTGLPPNDKDDILPELNTNPRKRACPSWKDRTGMVKKSADGETLAS